MSIRPWLAAVCAAVAIGAHAERVALVAQARPSDAGLSGVRVDVVDGSPRYTNRLIAESSPYLQLHAHNPVDWHPWGAAAFDKARREGKLIFLSIGYATCHWCHVMEAESFADPATAEALNRDFVAIKVDREERPDIDRLYMRYVQSATGGGAWPLSVFLTPEAKPFLGGGYFPPEDRDGMVAFRTVLERVRADWVSRRRTILEAATNGTAILMPRPGRRGTRTAGPVAPSTRVLDAALRDAQTRYDAVEGGFGAGEKFPRPATVALLLREHSRTGSTSALEMATQTLRAMARGGLHDHLGGGFHRYTTDRAWRVPHFEKMLYDQAQLALVYTEAYQVTGDAAYAAVARDTLDYVLRDLRDAAGGGIFSAEDADSAATPGAPLREGAFYVWAAGELRGVLDARAYEVFAFHYGVEPAGNVPPALDVEGQLAGQNVLARVHTVAETAARFGLSDTEVDASLEASREAVRRVRDSRPRPARDNQVLVAWNGLTISALARAAAVLEEPRYLRAAQDAARFVEATLYDAGTNRLKRRYRRGVADVDALLEDYACLVQALLDLYESSFDTRWLSWAVRLQERQDQLFWDTKGGAYLSTPASALDLLVRLKDDSDGAEPSGNSVAALNLLRLAQMTDRDVWRRMADEAFAALAQRLETSVGAVPQLAVAVHFRLAKPTQIVIAGEPTGEDTRVLLRLVHRRFMPNKILLLADGGAGQAQMARWLPFVGSMDRRGGRATIYICEAYACRLPTADPSTAERLLDGLPN